MDIALIDGLDASVWHGPGGAGGLSAVLLELFAVGLALGLAASSGERRPAAFLCLLLGPGDLGREPATFREHRADVFGDAEQSANRPPKFQRERCSSVMRPRIAGTQGAGRGVV
ncbi:hypothetical protein [Kitasatospora fiedleri]|uniref:hypothetical protein n=1 Tax=Kitasatospora fiedleri TaxID=2991545 RepID=UPI002499B734|nr:hypothetical protein [Kitasatospora fiedleri]